MKSHFSRQSQQQRAKNDRLMRRNNSRQSQSASEAIRLSRKEKLDQEIFDLHLLGFGACG